MQQDAIHTFRVYAPLRAALLVVLGMAACIAAFVTLDAYGSGWLQHHIIKMLAGVAVFMPFYFLFGRFATSIIDVKIDRSGFWISGLPGWTFGTKNDLFFGWIELKGWVYKKGKIDGHSISWDRLSFKLTDGRNILLLPTDDFDEWEQFPAFLYQLQANTETYNRLPSTQTPVNQGINNPTTGIKAWLTALMYLFGLVVSLIFCGIQIHDGAMISWMFLAGIFSALLMGFALWKTMKSMNKS